MTGEAWSQRSPAPIRYTRKSHPCRSARSSGDLFYMKPFDVVAIGWLPRDVTNRGGLTAKCRILGALTGFRGFSAFPCSSVVHTAIDPTRQAGRTGVVSGDPWFCSVTTVPRPIPYNTTNAGTDDTPALER